MVLSCVSYAFAYANPSNNGNAEDAPGHGIAGTTCDKAIDKQGAKGVEAGGGPKAGTGEAPSNCDHFFQDEE